MAVAGINPVSAPQKKDALDKIAAGLNIAQGILGVTLAIPEAIARGKERKQLGELRGAQIEKIKAETLTPEERKVETGIRRAKTFSEIGEYLTPAKEGETPQIDLGPEFGGGYMYKARSPQMNKYEEKTLDAYTKDYRIAKPGETPEFTSIFGGNELGFVKREDTEEKTKTQQSTDDLRKEFLKESSKFTDQTASYVRVKESAKDPSAAGDLALIFNYMKVLDPGSTVREGEFATAQQAASIPQRVWGQYNKVMAGQRLSPAQRADFLDRASRLYKGALDLHKTREKFYSNIAEARDLPLSDVIPDLTTNITQSVEKKPAPNGAEIVTQNGVTFRWNGESYEPIGGK